MWIGAVAVAAVVVVVGVFVMNARIMMSINFITTLFPRTFSFLSGAIMGALLGVPVSAIAFAIVREPWVPIAIETASVLFCGVGWMRFELRAVKTSNRRGGTS